MAVSKRNKVRADVINRGVAWLGGWTLDSAALNLNPNSTFARYNNPVSQFAQL